MSFYITKNTLKSNIFTIETEVINDSVVEELLTLKIKNKVLGLDMKNVVSIKSQKFVDYLLNNKVKLINLDSGVLAYLAIVIKDGFLRTYVSFNDFKENKRELIKRHFLIA